MGSERGVALVTVLVVVAVLSGILADLALSNRLWQQRVASGLAEAQARQAVRAAQPWIGAILYGDDPAFDARTDDWARTIPPLPMKWGEVTGSISDLQGRFNVNGLVGDDGKPDTAAVERFRRLLRVLQLDPNLADAVVDWLDADQLPRGALGAEDSFYMGRDPAYAAANRPLHTAEELRLVRGIGGEVWRQLEPHVTALPEATGININTATPEVLAAAIPSLGRPVQALSRARTWASRTNSQPFTELAAFRQALGGEEGGEGPELNGVSVASDFFRAIIEARFDQVRYRLGTVYQRGEQGVTLVRQQREWL